MSKPLPDYVTETNRLLNTLCEERDRALADLTVARAEAEGLRQLAMSFRDAVADHLEAQDCECGKALRECCERADRILYGPEAGSTLTIWDEVAGLRVALLPFAAHLARLEAQGYATAADDMGVAYNPVGPENITMGDLRAARAALKEQP